MTSVCFYTISYVCCIPSSHNVDDNQLTGTIPTELGLLTQMSWLQLGKDRARILSVFEICRKGIAPCLDVEDMLSNMLVYF